MKKFNLRCKKQPSIDKVEVFLIQEEWGVKVQADSDAPSDTLVQLWDSGEVFIDVRGAELFNLNTGYLKTKK